MWNVCVVQHLELMTRKRQPVAGVRLQMLNYVLADGANGDGLALSKVNQVGSDLRAVIAGWVPADTQTGGWRVEWWRPGTAFLFLFFLLLVFVCVCIHRGLVPLQLGLLQCVDVADGCGHRAGCLAQHGLAEGPHAGHVHSLRNSRTRESAHQVHVNSERTRAASTFDQKVEFQCKHSW